ncbi:MAG: MBL fold metallo-hydrolase [Spirochaetaceae bacterium]|nr:MBL fold metallo-hydrolase [Spirochaetaceae bacterium]MBR3813103.1 MBL fold metallo-hydrolase [Spirochaetaceae bacterium]
MKVYFHLCLEGFSNCYIVENDETKQALIIDPGTVNKEMIMQIEQNHFSLDAVLITHNHLSHYKGLRTLRKIYQPKVYTADYELAADDTKIIKGDGILKLIGTNVGYLSVPGHTADSMVYKIGKILFTGDALTAGLIGNTNNAYAEKILKMNIKTKILSQNEELVLMPGHGPPSTIKTEKQFNTQVYSAKSSYSSVKKTGNEEFITG